MSLDRADFDSTARFLQRVITDSIIDASIRSMPKEYQSQKSDLAARMRSRRNVLNKSADGYYRGLFTIVDLHGTDADDRATITRQADGSIDSSSNRRREYLDRRFLPSTQGIRLYPHSGNDARRQCTAPHIPLWSAVDQSAELVDSPAWAGPRAADTGLRNAVCLTRT